MNFRRIITLCAVVTDMPGGFGSINVGYAVKKPKDPETEDKEIGKKIAYGRAIKTPLKPRMRLTYVKLANQKPFLKGVLYTVKNLLQKGEITIAGIR